MKRLGNIYDKIRDMDNLIKAHEEASRGKGYYKWVQIVNKNPQYYLGKIQDMLKNGTYTITPKDYHITKIWDKTKERELWKLDYYPHRIIQWAIALQICNSLLHNFTYHTCASINGRGNKRVQELMLKCIKKGEYCLKIDIHHFYQSINHKILKKMLRKKFKDKKVLSLLDMIIDSYPGKVGIPIGSYLSQYLANFYLSYFDHRLKEALRISYVVRYMDDIVILSNSKERLRFIFKSIRGYLFHHLQLRLKSNYQVFPISRGIDFVGYRYFRNYTLLRKRIKNNIKKTIRKLGDELNENEYCSINSYRGWIKHCNGWRLYKTLIVPVTDRIFRYWRYNVVECKVSRSRCAKYYNKLIHWMDIKKR